MARQRTANHWPRHALFVSAFILCLPNVDALKCKTQDKTAASDECFGANTHCRFMFSYSKGKWDTDIDDAFKPKGCSAPIGTEICTLANPTNPNYPIYNCFCDDEDDCNESKGNDKPTRAREWIEKQHGAKPENCHNSQNGTQCHGKSDVCLYRLNYENTKWEEPKVEPFHDTNENGAGCGKAVVKADPNGCLLKADGDKPVYVCSCNDDLCNVKGSPAVGKATAQYKKAQGDQSNRADAAATSIGGGFLLLLLVFGH